MEFTDEMMQRFAANCNGMPIYLDDRMPELEDPSKELAEHHWQPACGTTSKLTRCLEAIRDLDVAITPLAFSHQPEADKRLVKQVVLPVYNLAIALRDLYNDVQSNRWTKLTKKQQTVIRKRFDKFGETVPTGTGALKTARDKIAAHLDKDVFTTEYRQFWESFVLADLLGWVRGCIRLLEALIPPDIYSWTRSSGYSNVWNLMNVDTSEVSLLMKDGQPHSIIGIKMSVSPKVGIVREARALMGKCAAAELRIAPPPSQQPGEKTV